MVTFENIIEYTKENFSDFKFNSTIDNQSSVVTFLLERLRIAIKEKNQDLLVKLANFINMLVINENEGIAPLIDDIALSIYSDDYYEKIKSHLSKKAIEIFDINIRLWKQGNKQN